MKRKDFLLLFLLGLIIPIFVSSYQLLPGYMDADYYYAGGMQLAMGKGFTEPYIWNYLDNPSALPHPSHTYWMPLASIVSAIGMIVFGQINYVFGRLPFVLLSAIVPVLTSTLAYDVSQNRLLANVSGLLSIFSMYYAPFMPVPDNYAIFMILGVTYLLLVKVNKNWVPLALGVIAGLMTLARSDGILWLGLTGLVLLWNINKEGELSNKPTLSRSMRLFYTGSIALLGYVVVMGPWHYRNIELFGSLMPPGGSRVLWLQTYDQIFSYPATSITKEAYLQNGWPINIKSRLAAFNLILGNTFAAQGGIFLFPLILIGLWKTRGEIRTRIVLIGWSVLFVVMSVAFPYPGARGSFFHGGAAFQPYLWVMAPIGLNIAIDGIRRRGWFDDQAYKVFQGMLVVLAFVFTIFLVNVRVVQSWAIHDGSYAAIEDFIRQNGFDTKIPVVVRNPPGYYINSGREAIALPYGGEEVIVEAARQFNAGILIIENGGTFPSIRDLYEHPGDTQFLTFVGEVDEAQIYLINIDR